MTTLIIAIETVLICLLMVTIATLQTENKYLKKYNEKWELENIRLRNKLEEQNNEL